MILIAAVDSAWAIGKGGRLLVKIPRDQKLFLEETLGKTVIMGRKTFLDLPGQQPLYGRRNIVLSRSPEFAPKGVTVCHSVGEVLREVRELPRDEVFVCGRMRTARKSQRLTTSMTVIAFSRIWIGIRNGN